MWYYIKPYALVGGGTFVAFTPGVLGTIAGVFAVVMGLLVFRMRGTI